MRITSLFFLLLGNIPFVVVHESHCSQVPQTGDPDAVAACRLEVQDQGASRGGFSRGRSPCVEAGLLLRLHVAFPLCVSVSKFSFINTSVREAGLAAIILFYLNYLFKDPFS